VSSSKIFLTAAIAAIVGFIAVWAVRPDYFVADTTVTLEFVPIVGDRAFELNQFAYSNPGGPGTFSIHDIKFYLSNLQLHGDGKSYIERDSYHLVRFDDAAGSFIITLNDVPLRTIDKIDVSIGVDADANGSIWPVGDLDANGQMAWNWEIGYKFVLFEGQIKIDDVTLPLVYHVGFDENRRDLSFAPPTAISLNDETSITFVVDVMKLFAGDIVVDMAELNTVKFDKPDARALAANYENMIDTRW